MSFGARRFESFGQAGRDLYHLLRDPRPLLGVVTGRGPVSPELREKLMLSVTSVNRCRYCSFVHTKIALREGMSREEVQRLLAGVVDDVADDERQALLYAQHWADTGGHPDVSARREVVAAYGEERTAAIEASLRMIMFGNYFGNTVDAVLDKLTLGLAGKPS
jgi:AhpD family alkylhydroperoxidase